jgi:transposase
LLHGKVTTEIACPRRAGWQDVKPYSKEFRDDVVWVARNREDGAMIEQIAADFGVHPMRCRSGCVRPASMTGPTPGKTTGESAELRELRRRN